MSRTTRLALLTVLGAILATASITSAASAAAQRYASPTGTGTDCTSANPCSIRQAVENASVGDEVIVRPGTFSLTTTLETPQPITIHGVAGQQRPRLVFSGGGDGLRVIYGSTLQYVAVEKAPGVDGKALYAAGAVVDQVIATASDDYETAEIRDGTISNSIVVASGPQAPAIMTSASNAPTTSTYRNVTAIATGSHAVPIMAWSMNQGSVTVHLVNVIAYRGPGANSLEAYTDNSGAKATITATHTNYQAVAADGVFGKFVDGGGNRAEEPVFVNAAAGDYRQAPGAYTIDAGLDDPLTGAFDVDGDPRRIGTTDIGADEFVPVPTATTGPASALTGQSATLTGSVNARGVPTTYRFQYDTTTAYGTTTPATGAGSGTTAAAANAAVSGLRPGTTYHYRLVATNAGGVTHGADHTFTTTSTPDLDGPTPAFAGVRLVSTRLTYARRSITVKMTCPAATVGRCSGRTKLTARRRPTSSSAPTRVTLGRATFSIAAGQQGTVRVRVSRAGRLRLRGVRRLRGRVRNAATSGAGEAKTTMARVTIRRRHR